MNGYKKQTNHPQSEMKKIKYWRITSSLCAFSSNGSGMYIFFHQYYFSPLPERRMGQQKAIKRNFICFSHSVKKIFLSFPSEWPSPSRLLMFYFLFGNSHGFLSLFLRRLEEREKIKWTLNDQSPFACFSFFNKWFWLVFIGLTLIYENVSFKLIPKKVLNFSLPSRLQISLAILYSPIFLEKYYKVGFLWCVKNE